MSVLGWSVVRLLRQPTTHLTFHYHIFVTIVGHLMCRKRSEDYQECDTSMPRVQDYKDTASSSKEMIVFYLANT